MEAFVYRWRNIETGMWYIGYHKGTPDDGYICSSKIARPLIKANPEQWSRKILKVGTKFEMCQLERHILKKLNARLNPLSYNKHNGNGHVYTGRTKGTGHKLNPKILLETCERICGKSYWMLLLESYRDCIIKQDWPMVRKYETKILKKILGFDPEYFKNNKYYYDGK